MRIPNLSRRRLMGGALGGIVATTLAPAWGTEVNRSVSDAIDLARRQRQGDLSRQAVVESAAASLEALAPRLGLLAFSSAAAAAERVRRAPADRVAIPTLVKDLDDQQGAPTRFGSAPFAAAKAATRNAPYVSGLMAINGVSLGKSRTSEFGLSPVIEGPGLEPCRNPWDLALSAGGSSGGAAAAVAAGIVPIAHASDGGGSIRIPAALCGVFGFKPSRGRGPVRAGAADVTALVADHVISRSVRDSALVLAALQNPASTPQVPLLSEPGDAPRLRIGVISESLTGTKPHTDVTVALADATGLLRAAGHEVREIGWALDRQSFAEDFLSLWCLGAADSVAGVRREFGSRGEAALQPLTLALARRARPARADVTALTGRLTAAKAAYDAMFESIDVLMTPVLTQAQVAIGSLPADGDAAIDALRTWVGYTPIQNVAGAPAMSMPLGWTPAGLPVGVHFSARAGEDERLLRLALELEARAPWAHRWPGLRATPI